MKRNAQHALPPVNAIIRYKRDVVVRRGPTYTRRRKKACTSVSTRRGCVHELSKKSLARLSFVGWNTDVKFESMVTLTYPAEYPTNGAEVKRHLRAFLQWCRRRWDKPSYLWFFEFQKRGAPHVHILLSAKVCQDDYTDVSASWYRIVGSGDECHLRAGTRTERLRNKDARYAVCYASKPEQKRVPKGFQSVGRWWGHSKDVTPRPRSKLDVDEQSARAVLDKWGRLPPEGSTLYRVLYGAAEAMSDYEDMLSDIDTEIVDVL